MFLLKYFYFCKKDSKLMTFYLMIRYFSAKVIIDNNYTWNKNNDNTRKQLMLQIECQTWSVCETEKVLIDDAEAIWLCGVMSSDVTGCLFTQAGNNLEHRIHHINN